ncbi:MAG TPA: transcriptional repressor LexA [Gammaproteobacteria bacterium]|nr:transcriptional repressor LexA [Gammaproteobacteria bacterium]
MQALTPRQAQILDLIREALALRGAPPTVAELAAALGVKSAHGVRGHLQALARKGAIELIPGVSRGIRLLEDEEDAGSLPIVGRVAAGSPILAEQHIEAYRPLGPGQFRPKAHYLLRVRGMSMRDAGILDGDLVAVHRTVDVRNGQIVVARLDDEVTVKYWRMSGSRALLEPANPDFSPIEVDLARESLCIEGRVVGVIRDV